MESAVDLPWEDAKMTPGEVLLPLHGGCGCRGVRYQVTGAPLMAHICHCHDCQTRTGSAFSLMVLVRSAELEVTGGMSLVRRTTSRGVQLDNGVCPSCGLVLLGRAVAAAEFTTLRAGTLDDAGWVRPIAQTWVASAIPWAIVPDVAQVEPHALNFYALGEAWRATAPVFRPA